MRRTWPLVVAVAVAAVAVVLLGDRLLTPVDVVSALDGSSDGGLRYVVTQVRLPVAAAGILAGAALGASGAIFQSLLRNPLASPDVIGIQMGASAATVASMVLWGLEGWALAGVALAGAGAAAFGIYALSHHAQEVGGALILHGVAIGAMLSALVVHLLTRADARQVGDVYRWLTGSLDSTSWQEVAALAGALALLLPASMAARRKLVLLELGDDAAASLGVRVAGVRMTLVGVGAALSAVAVVATGPIAFVSLMAGPLARMTSRGRASLPRAALFGALLVTGAETVGNTAFGGTDLPVGVVTGALGAPFLMWLLTRSRRT